MRGSSMTDEELAEFGVVRKRDMRGKRYYEIPCDICGKKIGLHAYSTDRVYKCRTCNKNIKARRKIKVEAAREEVLSILAEELGTDYKHLKRFERGSDRFGPAYRDDIEKARTAIDKFDSMPEVTACIELLHIGARVIVHQRVGDYTVDFCLPDEKVVIEVDGDLYHANAGEEFVRDNAITHMLGDGWTVRHVPADAITKRHETFGRGMRKMLNEKREELGMEKLGT